MNSVYVKALLSLIVDKVANRAIDVASGIPVSSHSRGYVDGLYEALGYVHSVVVS